MSRKFKFSTAREAFFLFSRPGLWFRRTLAQKDMAEDPIKQFSLWYDSAKRSLWKEFPNAMTLSTVDSDGFPDGRMVLLKSFDEQGLVFYTHVNSKKGLALVAGEKASLCFYWGALQRQIRIKGNVDLIDEKQADAYFATRPRDSQIGAWASKQSEVLDDREVLMKRFNDFSHKFLASEVPRPKHWVGFCLDPVEFEFWQLRLSRLHDRFLYRKNESGKWEIARLYP